VTPYDTSEETRLEAPTNPWLAARSIDLPAEEPAPVSQDSAPPALGPTTPQAGVPEPERCERLPRVPVDAAAALWWVGVHGGAGESTLAALVPGSRASGHAWPIRSGDAGDGGLIPVALVARTSMSGIRAAQAAATQWATGAVPDVELLGLVWLADAPGKLPRSLRDFADVVSGGVPRVWRVPWIDGWRTGADPATEASPKQLRRLLQDVRSLVPELNAADRGTV
jgi:hypothetical protein